MSFALATVSAAGSPPFVVMVLGGKAVALQAVYRRLRDAGALKRAFGTTDSILGLLQDWEPNLDGLVEIAEWVRREGLDDRHLAHAVSDFTTLRALPPILRPSKMLYAAANYREHVAEMRASNFTGGAFDKQKDFGGEKAKARPYSFLKAPSCLVGANDDIVLPRMFDRIDWEIELALAIGRPGKHIPAARAMDHVAGFMTTNDISCRSLTYREDRPTTRSDWLGGKSHDTFAPTGPYFVPRLFVKDHMNLRLTLKLNGETMQDSVTGQMIFSPEEQIEYCSHMLTLEPGDMFATGTPSGVGQGRGLFLKAGDVIESTIEGIGAQRNRVVAEEGNI
jgi:2-keto-4-pentenoate hydratase/2-oxohepta-3-ene-1,7-dioic acid hydratase in catechol pathway